MSNRDDLDVPAGFMDIFTPYPPHTPQPSSGLINLQTNDLVHDCVEWSIETDPTGDIWLRAYDPLDGGYAKTQAANNNELTEVAEFYRWYGQSIRVWHSFIIRNSLIIGISLGETLVYRHPSVSLAEINDLVTAANKWWIKRISTDGDIPDVKGFVASYMAKLPDETLGINPEE